MAEDKFNFGKMIAALQSAKVELPNALAQTGQLFFQQNFNRSEWDGIPWEPRKDKKNKKHLLVKTGRLRQSLQNSIREVSYKQITWGTDIPYAKYQNFGTDTIPQREFMGESKKLNDKFKTKIKSTFDKVMSGK